MPDSQDNSDRENIHAELFRAHEREAATRKILAVVSQSRDDEIPVFQAIVENAARLCNAPMTFLVLINEDHSEWKIAAATGDATRMMQVGNVFKVAHKFAPYRSIKTGQIVEEPDIRETEFYKSREADAINLVDVDGVLSRVFVPLVSRGGSLGNLVLLRREVGKFAPEDLLLVEDFATQAVIAIENVRQFREVQTRLQRETASREILGIISQSRDDEKPVFDSILRNACKLCNAPLAYLSMASVDRKFVYSPARQGAFAKFGETLDKLKVPLAESRLALARSISECRVFREDDIADHELYTSGDPNRVSMVEDEGARSLLVVPLIHNRKGIGAITLYRREIFPFSEDDVLLVEGFAAQAVIAIENVRQFRALEALNAELGDRVEEQVGEIERMGRLKRFLPTAVADTVVTSGSEAMLQSHRALLGVLFCDIRGFTAFCETAEPEETIEVLQTYHEEMGKLINAHRAGVDHRMGDGIMVLFNDPLPCEDPAGDAVRLAVAMRAKMVELSKQWKRLGHRLGFGVGVSLGYATVGMVGYEGRSDYTASGTAINVAARLCDMADDGEILLSTRAAIAVEDEFPSVSAGEVTLKGIREPVEVFRMNYGNVG